MYDIEHASKEQLKAIAYAALAMSTKMVDTEQVVNENRSSFQVEKEWSALTAAFSSIYEK